MTTRKNGTLYYLTTYSCLLKLLIMTAGGTAITVVLICCVSASTHFSSM